MSTLFTKPFTAADAIEWITVAVGFEKIEGASFEATIVSNRGGAGATAAERIYRPKSFPGVTNYIARVNMDWKDAVTTGRVMALGVRVSTDAKYGYWVEVDSNVGTPRYRLRRRANGTYTDLVAWTNLTGVTSGNLNAGVDVEIRVETKATAVNLVVKVKDVQQTDTDDTNAVRVESGGTLGIKIGANCVTDDVTVDDLTADDFKAEAAGAITEGIALSIDSTYYDESEWRALGISPQIARDSYGDEPAISIADLNPFTSPALSPGMDIGIDIDGTRVASGVLRLAETDASPLEGTRYEVASPAQLAREVPIRNPKTGAGQIVYNMPAGHAQYDADRANLEIGAAIADILDNHADGDDGGRENGSMPPDGAIYTQAELDAIDADVSNLQVSGDALSAVETLLTFMPSFARRIDPETRGWQFHDRSASASKDISLDSKHVEARFGIAPDDIYTAILVRGTRAKSTLNTIKLSTAGLSKAWNASVEASHAKEKAYRVRDAGSLRGTAPATGVDGSGNIYVDVDALTITMDDHEWDGAPFVVLGETYKVKDNIGLRVTLTATAWQTSAPAPATTFAIGGGTELGTENGHTSVFRDFEISDAKLGLLGGKCYTARVMVNGGKSVWETKAQFMPPVNVGDKATVRLDTPAVQQLGLINYPVSDQDACKDGGMTIADDVEIDVETYDVDTAGNGAVSELRVPAAGYRGPAYSSDAGVWDGAGKPGYGDHKFRRTLTVEDPSFTGSTADVTAWTKMCNAILAVTGKVARTAQIRVSGLDTSWAGLDRKVTLSSTERTLPTWMTDGSLWLLSVEWDLAARTTTLHVGTLSSQGGVDLAAMRQRFISDARIDVNKRLLDQMEEMWRCVANAMKGSGQVGAPDPTPIGDCQVTTQLGGISSALSKSRHVDVSCVTKAIADPNCTGTACDTMTPSELKNAADAIKSKTVKTQETDKFSAGTDMAVVDAACAALNHIQAIEKFLAAWGSSVDTQLGRGGVDLQNLMTQLNGYDTCIDAALTAICTAVNNLDTRVSNIQTCFNNALATKADAPGIAGSCAEPSVTCAFTLCDITWTPTLCEPPVCKAKFNDPT